MDGLKRWFTISCEVSICPADSASDSASCLFPGSGDPRHRAPAHPDDPDAQPLGAHPDHRHGGGGSRAAAAHNQRGSHRLPDVRHPSEHGPEDHLLWEQVRDTWKYLNIYFVWRKKVVNVFKEWKTNIFPLLFN